MTQEAIDLLLNRRSIRRYKPDPVDGDALDLILKAGTRSATPAEMQFYSFIVVDDRETLARLDVRSPVAIVACVDLHRHNRWATMRGAAPLEGTAPDLLFCFWDVALSIQNMVVAAESLGLGTLTAIRDMSGLFDLPDGVYPAGVLAIGHPDEAPPLRHRFPLEAVVHRGRYEPPTDEELEAWYRGLDDRWTTAPRGALLALGDESCTNYAQVLATLLRRETGWIRGNLEDTGLRVGEASS